MSRPARRPPQHPARSPAGPGTAERDTPSTRTYVGLLLLSGVLGVVVALAGFFFVGLQHTFQHGVWVSLPHRLGQDGPPWWWPLPALLPAGLILAPIVTRMPGGGGHLPVHGLGGPPTGPRELPGVVLAALLTLPLGVVLGPEAPLMALGSGMALLAAHRLPPGPRAKAAPVLATAGSTAAISTILGSPLVAAVLIVESAGLAGPSLLLLLLPCLLAAGAGALVFTGFGRWTGLKTGGLTLPTVPPAARPDAGDFLWGIPAAALIAVLVVAARRGGRWIARWTAQRHATPHEAPPHEIPPHRAKPLRIVLCAVAVGVCLTAYALLTGRSPEEAALSGQATLAELAAHPHGWSVAALIALLLCKGVAWSLCLGSCRGGPIFPAVLLGAAAAMACAGLPGLGATPALALGIAAAASAITGLALSGSVLTVVLLGKDGYDQTPLIAVSAVVAVLVARGLRSRTGEEERA